jgi:hypothetical protein
MATSFLVLGPKNSTGDILGRRTRRRADGTNMYRYSVRTYNAMSSFTKIDQRPTFGGCSHDVAGTAVNLCLGSIILATFIGPRPEGYVVHNDGATWNNLLNLLRWSLLVTTIAKRIKSQSAANLSIYTSTVLDIKKKMLQHNAWYLHPNQEIFPVMVNTAGTHIYNIEKQKFLPIRRYLSKLSTWVFHPESANGNRRRTQKATS